jgi:hypothetical protein
MNNETKQTAVDLLWSMIPESTQSYIEHQWNGYKKAKEIEKEQIKQVRLDAKEIIIIKHTEHKGGEQ